MKVKISATVILVLVLIFVFVNAAVIGQKAASYKEKVAALSPTDEGILERVTALYRDFRAEERYISLTVNHDDLTNIEEAFAELIGAAEAGDDEQFVITKSRLEDALTHLGRLSGVNLDSIF